MAKQTVSTYMYSQYPGHVRAYLSEYFSYFETLQDDESRIKSLIEFLQELASSKLKVTAYKKFLMCMFNDRIKLDLPEGIPDKMQFPKLPDMASSSIWKSMGVMEYFIKVSPSYIKDDAKRERIFLQLLEAMHEGDAFLMVAMKDKNYKFVPGLTLALLQQAYPGWFPLTLGDQAPANPDPITETMAIKKRPRGRPTGTTKKSILENFSK